MELCALRSVLCSMCSTPQWCLHHCIYSIHPRYYNVDYEPDPLVMCQDEVREHPSSPGQFTALLTLKNATISWITVWSVQVYSADNLIELAPGVPRDPDDNSSRGEGEWWEGNMVPELSIMKQLLILQLPLFSSPYPGGGGGFSAPPLPSYTDQPAPFNYPAPGPAAYIPPPGAPYTPPQSAPYPPPSDGLYPMRSESPVATKSNLNMLDDEGGPPPYFPPDLTNQQATAPSPAPALPDLPELPAVPLDTPPISKAASPADPPEEEIDFDDLTKRFEALKKKK